MPNPGYDFSGYATKYNVKCGDGRTILPAAFKDTDGVKVPLVWQHLHDAPDNVVGHALLEHRDDGVYAYGYFNSSEAAKNAKILVEHKDIGSLSIYANKLVEKAKNVSHGVIREVSLVLSGSNPGALIDNVSIAHGYGEDEEISDEAIIYTDELLVLPDEKKEDPKEDPKEEAELSHADPEDGDETVAEVLETLSEKQKLAMYAVIGQIVEGNDMEQSALQNSNNEGDSQNIMKKNVFDGSTEVTVVNERPRLSQADFSAIMENAQKRGSLKHAFMEHEAGAEFLAHAGTYGIDNISYLFPDARSVSQEPGWISRRMEWVSKVLNATRHSPFSRIKSLHADITPDAARAKGYVTGALKTEEVFAMLRRITNPWTVYKKQKLDRDDIIDITDFNVVAWLKREMRWMLDEELARAILVGDGRDPVTQVADHIPHDNIRPVWLDTSLYTYVKQVASTRTTDQMIDDMITARVEYRGTGAPSLYVGPTFLTAMLLLRDLDGRRLYRTEADLASELRVKEIVEVPIMDGLSRGTPVYNLMAIMANLSDYVVGADKGGEINFFDDFDIDYNQEKYLIETRVSGALVEPKAAIVLEQAEV